MKTIYLDNDFMCHLTNDGTMTEVQTEVFDGLCTGAIECYRFIPTGQKWTRSDGQVFHGPFIQPHQLTETIDKIQQQYEIDETNHLNELGVLIEDLYNTDLEVIG